MDYSNSQQLLTTLSNKGLDDNSVKDIFAMVEKMCAENSLDIDKVSGEVNRAIVTTSDIRNMGAFVRGVIRKVDPVLFKKEEHKIIKPSVWELHCALIDNLFAGEWWEQFLIDDIEEFALNEKDIDVRDLIWTNREIVKFCMLHNRRTLKDFKDLFLKSRIMKGKVLPIEEMTESAKKLAKHYEEIFRELGDLYGKN